MGFNPEIHHRRSIRLQGYDYSTEGAYFITVCVQDGESLFGGFANGEICLNNAGRMVEATWNELSTHYPGVQVDVHVVMPNHFHAIIFLVGAAPRGRPEDGYPQGKEGHPRGKEGHPRGGAPTGMSLCDVIHRFKSFSTARYRHAVTEHAWPPFPGRLWQRGYYERIIRSEGELNGARRYILENPVKWAWDKNNPVNIPCE